MVVSWGKPERATAAGKGAQQDGQLLERWWRKKREGS